MLVLSGLILARGNIMHLNLSDNRKAMDKMSVLFYDDFFNTIFNKNKDLKRIKSLLKILFEDYFTSVLLTLFSCIQNQSQNDKQNNHDTNSNDNNIFCIILTLRLCIFLFSTHN